MQVIRHILLLGALSLFPLCSVAQNLESDSLNVEIESRMMQYADDLNQLAVICNMNFTFSNSSPLSTSYVNVLNSKMKMVQESYNAIDMRWNTFTQAMQADIADSENLMELMTQVQQLKQMVADTLASKKQKVDALGDFAHAEELLLNPDSTYKRLYKTAFELSLVSKLAPRLEKVKATEQVIFANLQSSYEKAKAATALMPQLSSHMEIIEEKFTNLKAISEKIQAMEYKPLFIRLKDYLIGFACVAILLMFVNMLWAKLQALKKARQSAKQYQDMMHNNGGQQYPTI